MEEDSDWGTWGQDPAEAKKQSDKPSAASSQHLLPDLHAPSSNQQQTATSSIRPPPGRTPPPGKQPSAGVTPSALPAASNGGTAKPVVRRSSSRQSSFTRLGTTAPAVTAITPATAATSATAAAAATPSDPQSQTTLSRQTSAVSQTQKPLSRQTSEASSSTAGPPSRAASQGSSAALDDWQSLLADSPVPPIKVQAAKAKLPIGAHTLPGTGSLPSSATKSQAGPDATDRLTAPVSQLPPSKTVPPLAGVSASAAPGPRSAARTLAGPTARTSTATAAPQPPPSKLSRSTAAATASTGTPLTDHPQGTPSGSTPASGAAASSSRVNAQMAGLQAGMQGQAHSGSAPVSSTSRAAATARVSRAAPAPGPLRLISGPTAETTKQPPAGPASKPSTSRLTAKVSKADPTADHPTLAAGIQAADDQMHSAPKSAAASAASRPAASTSSAAQGAEETPKQSGMGSKHAAKPSSRYSTLMASLSPQTDRTAAFLPPRRPSASQAALTAAALPDAALSDAALAASACTAGTSASAVSAAPAGGDKVESVPSLPTALGTSAKAGASVPARAAAGVRQAAPTAISPPAPALEAPTAAAPATASATAPASSAQAPAPEAAHSRKAQSSRTAALAGSKPASQAALPKPSKAQSGVAAAATTAAASDTAAHDAAVLHSNKAQSAVAAAVTTAAAVAAGAGAASAGSSDSHQHRPAVTEPVRSSAEQSPLPEDSFAALSNHAAPSIPFAAFGSAPGGDDDFFNAAGDVRPETPSALEPPQHLPTALDNVTPSDSFPSRSTAVTDQAGRQAPGTQTGSRLIAGAVKPLQTLLPLPDDQTPAAPAAAALHTSPVTTTAATSVASMAALEEAAASAAAASSAAAFTKPDDTAIASVASTAASSDAKPTAEDQATTTHAQTAPTETAQQLPPTPVQVTASLSIGKGHQEDTAQTDSDFVPIPFGGSSASGPTFAVSATGASFGSYLDLEDDFGDSFFDSMGTGETPLPEPGAASAHSQLNHLYPLAPAAGAATTPHTQQLQVSSGPSASQPSAATASAPPMSHGYTGGAHMSQELPSFHDWSQNAPITSAVDPSSHSNSTQSAAAIHPDGSPTVSTEIPPQEADESSGQQAEVDMDVSNLSSSAQTHAADTAPELQLLSQLPSQFHDSHEQPQQQAKPDVLSALQSGAAQQAAKTLDATGGLDSSHDAVKSDNNQQGGSPQRQKFSIPFSGQSDPLAEEEDDLFGTNSSQYSGPYGAPAPVTSLAASEPSFSFDDVSIPQAGTSSVDADDFGQHPSMLYTASAPSSHDGSHAQQLAAGQGYDWQGIVAQPQQHDAPLQDLYGMSSQAMLTQPGQQQQDPNQAPGPWPQTQSQLQPQSPSLFQSQSSPSSQSLFQPQLPFQPQFQSRSQPQSLSQSQPQFQSPAQSQGNLFSPVRQQPYGQGPLQAPQLFVPKISSSQGNAPPAKNQFPSVPTLPFQQHPGKAIQSSWLPIDPPVALQLPGRPLAVNTQRVSSPYAVDNGQQAQQDLYGEDDSWLGPNEAAALGQPQEQGQSGWPHQDIPNGTQLGMQSVSEGLPIQEPPAAPAAPTSKQYDPWTGQHVPSQGFPPNPTPVLQSHGAEALNAPSYLPGQAPAAPVTSAAASPFPATMSSPFAQAGYPPHASSDPWASQPVTSSSSYPVPFQPSYTSSSSAQPANPWGPGTAYSSTNLWDPVAAAVSPWDAGSAGQTPADTLGGEYGGQDSGYRSTDGRPAIALMVFGFAGKMYCWRPASSSSGLGGTAGTFANGHVGSLQFLTWPKPASEVYSTQQQQQQQQQHQPEQQSVSQQHQEPSMSASHLLLSRFPGPLMPNTSKDKVLKFVNEACSSCLQTEPQCREPAELQMLWKVLQLLCQHKGDLHSAITPGVNDKRLEALLSAILVPSQTQVAAPTTPASDPWASGSAAFPESGGGLSSEVLQPQPGFGDLQETANQMQQLLMAGHRLEALSIAVAGQLWGPALLLARHCGDKAFLETAAAMAAGSTTAGSPLHTLTLLMSGKADAVHAVPAEHAKPAPGSSLNQASGAAVLVPYGSPFAQPIENNVDVLSQWRGNLAIMTGNRVAGDDAAMVKLGDRLWLERSQALAAHICYVLAGLHTQPCDPASQLCLVGTDHRRCPRRFASIAAMQRSEVLEWARSQGNSSYTLQHGLMLLPYKFLYAAQLAEHGLISEAAQYCGAIQQALGALPKLPPGLAVCRSFTQDLVERLQTYAAAHNIPLQMSRSRSILSVSGVGKWLDRGLSKLMGGPEPPPQSGPGSNGSTQSDADPYVAKSKHRRNTSDQYLESDTPEVHMPKRSQSSQDMLRLHHHTTKGTPSLASTPEKVAEPTEGTDNGQEPTSKGEGQGVSGHAQKAGGLGWGVMSRVASGLLGSGSKKAPPDKKVTEAKLGDKNKFYYDDQLKQWREEGKEAPPPSGPPPPPPKMTPQRAPSGPLASGLTRAPSSGAPSVSGRPPLPGGGPPSSGPSSGGQSSGTRSAVRSRYVSNFTSGSNPISSPATAAVPLVPPRPFGALRAGPQPAQVFQPSAAAVAAETLSSDRSAESDSAAVQPAMPFVSLSGRAAAPIDSRSSGSGGAALQSPYSSSSAAVAAATAVPRHNPYAQMPGMTSVGKAAVPAVAARNTGTPLQRKAVAIETQNPAVAIQYQHASLSSGAQMAGMDSSGQGLGASQLPSPPPEDPSIAEDLVTTYSSFSHDPVDAYAALGSAPAVAYSASGNLLDPLGGSGQTAAVTTAHSDGVAQHGDVSHDDFGEMTELQL